MFREPGGTLHLYVHELVFDVLLPIAFVGGFYFVSYNRYSRTDEEKVYFGECEESKCQHSHSDIAERFPGPNFEVIHLQINSEVEIKLEHIHDRNEKLLSHLFVYSRNSQTPFRIDRSFPSRTGIFQDEESQLDQTEDQCNKNQLAAVTDELARKLVFCELWPDLSTLIINHKLEDVRKIIKKVRTEDVEHLAIVVWEVN